MNEPELRRLNVETVARACEGALHSVLALGWNLRRVAEFSFRGFGRDRALFRMLKEMAF